MPSKCACGCGERVSQSGCFVLGCRPVGTSHDPRGKMKAANAKGNAKNNPKNSAKNNAKRAAKISATKKRKRAAYEYKTFGIEVTDEEEEEAGHLCIQVIKQKIEAYKKLHPEGFMVMIFGTSVGSGTIVNEGKMQLSGRGYHTPPVVDAQDKTIHYGLQGSHGPGGVSVYDCGPSKVLSKAMETAAQEYFTPICDAPVNMMPRTWRVIGAGSPKGTGPYHVCIRVLPLPLPHGWHRSF